jgi:hypothetical protein
LQPGLREQFGARASFQHLPHSSGRGFIGAAHEVPVHV